MTKIGSDSRFIEKSLELLTASPRDTSVGITYTHSKDKKKRALVRFKVYNSKSGVCLSLQTHKVKELSRVLNALGPHDTTVTNIKQENIPVKGISSVMTNVEVPEEVKLEVEAPAEGPKKGKKGKKKSKKKGKRH